MHDGPSTPSVDMAKNSLATQATKADSPIASATSDLQKVHSILKDEIFMLADRLQPVLAPSDPTDRADEAPRPPQSDMADFINRETSAVVSMIEFVKQLRTRTEL